MIDWLRARKSLLEHISATLLIGLALSFVSAEMICWHVTHGGIPANL